LVVGRVKLRKGEGKKSFGCRVKQEEIYGQAKVGLTSVR
jgi:hypothetical protein